jgi:ATP phosphoribosyltransferase regulatory subunit HisZ
LPELHGGEEVWAQAEAVFKGTSAERPTQELKALWQAATESGIDVDLMLDLGETWRFDYYTGPMFQLLGEGPGLPIGSGGRYDELYARFGVQHPAAGCALDLDNLAWACRGAEASLLKPVRVLVLGKGAPAEQLLEALRAERVVAAPAPEQDVLSYAKAWRYSHLLESSAGALTLTDVANGSVSSVPQSVRQIADSLRASYENT